MIVYVSVSPSSVNSCFIYFEALLLGKYKFKCYILLIKYEKLHLYMLYHEVLLFITSNTLGLRAYFGFIA